mmetsp:Transcript_30247/g.84526  ORF Transcript_30247/g.84526 Transcript_30247/m.84526 type:complete len:872 (-) Transcript_30247:40-2655(-)
MFSLLCSIILSFLHPQSFLSSSSVNPVYAIIGEESCGLGTPRAKRVDMLVVEVIRGFGFSREPVDAVVAVIASLEIKFKPRMLGLYKKEPGGSLSKLVQKTSICYAQKEPEWNETLILWLESDVMKEFHIHVLVINSRDSSVLGMVSVPIEELLETQGKIGCFSLSCPRGSQKGGKILLWVSYSPYHRIFDGNYLIAENYQNYFAGEILDGGVSFAVAHALMVADDTDDLVEAIMELARGRKCLSALLDVMLDYELRNTKQETTIFRQNTCLSKMCRLLLRRTGRSYLHAIMADVVKNVMASCHDAKENPIPSGEGREYSQSRLEEMSRDANTVLDRVLDKENVVPVELTALAAIVHRGVEERFPGCGLLAVQSVVWLRFILPALVNPHVWYVVDTSVPSSPECHAALAQISKIVQKRVMGSLELSREDRVALFLIDLVKSGATAGEGVYDAVVNDEAQVMYLSEVISKMEIHLRGLELHGFVSGDVLQKARGQQAKLLRRLMAAKDRLKERDTEQFLSGVLKGNDSPDGNAIAVACPSRTSLSVANVTRGEDDDVIDTSRIRDSRLVSRQLRQLVEYKQQRSQVVWRASRASLKDSTTYIIKCKGGGKQSFSIVDLAARTYTLRVGLTGTKKKAHAGLKVSIRGKSVDGEGGIVTECGVVACESNDKYGELHFEITHDMVPAIVEIFFSVEEGSKSLSFWSNLVMLPEGATPTRKSLPASAPLRASRELSPTALPKSTSRTLNSSLSFGSASGWRIPGRSRSAEELAEESSEAKERAKERARTTLMTSRASTEAKLPGVRTPLYINLSDLGIRRTCDHSDASPDSITPPLRTRDSAGSRDRTRGGSGYNTSTSSQISPSRSSPDLSLSDV